MRLAVAALALLVAAPALAKPPTWDSKIDTPKRFKVLKAFDSEAVLDQETGLVWMQTPQLTDHSFGEANQFCTLLEISGRGGWRLPTVSEMSSLLPPVSQALPDGHPFVTANAPYWTATLADATHARVGDLGDPGSTIASLELSDFGFVWCVRGGLGGSTD